MDTEAQPRVVHKHFQTAMIQEQMFTQTHQKFAMDLTTIAMGQRMKQMYAAETNNATLHVEKARKTADKTAIQATK